MGLDMYLRANTYTSNNDYYQKNPELFDEVLQNLELTPDELNAEMLNMTISIPVVYWRKENAIHNWFVKNVQNHNDDCGKYYVSREQLIELIELCEQVSKDNSLAHELLPTTDGFFFGGTAYDDYYFKGLEKTARELRQFVYSPRFNDFDFEYQSSW